ncbi:hypothetical protein BGZ68_009330 [Mortierella alpina]|nr:hypothetical protein BGZ68_009330 [Mortierella alpina]
MTSFENSEHPMSVASIAPHFSRSLSAPHLQFPTFHQDFFTSSRPATQNLSQGSIAHHHIGPAIQEGVRDPSQQFSALDQTSLSPASSIPVHFERCQAGFSPDMQPCPVPVFGTGSNSGYDHAKSIHPFQMEQLSLSINDLEHATASRIKNEYPDGFHGLVYTPGPGEMQDTGIYRRPLSSSPPTTPQANGSDSLFNHSFENNGSPFNGPSRDYSLSCFEVPDAYPPYVYPRHCSLGSLYPITQSHELLESFQAPVMCSGESTPMLSTSSSTSISSDASLPPKNPSCSVNASSKRRASTTKSRATRRASLSSESGRLYPCIFDDCGKLFKRSEHLKRHVRSVHTLEKRE